MGFVARPTAVRRDPALALWVAAGAGWMAIVVLMLVPGGMWSMPAHAAAGLTGSTPGPSPVWVFTVFLIGWVVMVAAMMLPTMVPMARMFTMVTADVPARRRVLGAFYGSYLVVWLAAGVLGLGVAFMINRATDGVPARLVLAGALAVAGVFQFTTLKSRCLTQCRDPRSFIFSRYRRGIGAAWSLGLRHALSCLGCCWALMAVMFAVGSGGLIWMLGLTAVMAAEKSARWGRRLTKPVGVALLLAAVIIAALALTSMASESPFPRPMPGHQHTHHHN